MAVYTDNPQFAATFLTPEVANGLVPAGGGKRDIDPLLSAVFRGSAHLYSSEAGDQGFPTLLLSEFSPQSQYDQLIDLARTDAGLPDRLACVAGWGTEFHGFKGRPWAAVPGNLHLAVHFRPDTEVERFEVAFTILAALSVAEALNQIAGLEEKALIKWVNDILLDGAKVGGVLAYTQSQGKAVTSAVLGIGVNLENTPAMAPSPFVPRVAAVRDFLPTGHADVRATVLRRLLGSLEENYGVLLEEGISPLLERYRAHSIVVGRDVTICTESSNETVEVISTGRVVALGENLELVLEGQPEPITGGRLILGGSQGSAEDSAPGAGEGGLAPMVAKGIAQ